MPKTRRVLFTKFKRVEAVGDKAAFLEEIPNQLGNLLLWGMAYEVFEMNAGNYTIGIVEDDLGHVHEVEPRHIQFVYPGPPQTSQ